MVKPLSQAAIGRALGLSQASITKLKGQGMPVDSVESARAWRKARQNIAARKPEPVANRAPVIRANEVNEDGSELGESQDDARTRREIAEANLAEMKESEQRGELIRVEAVKSALAHAYSSTRDALLQIPARLAPLLAADAEPASVQNSLYSEIHLALQHLAGASEQIGQTGATA
jgi:phage terminase Nu1 subunit (DNA packaging protein)